MYTLEFIPDELALQILSHLKFKDLLTCRIVSTLMCQKIDRLFNHKFCLVLNEKSQKNFSLYKSHHNLLNSSEQQRAISKLNTLKVGSLVWMQGNKSSKGNPFSLQPQHFTFITELEFTQAIRTKLFQQIIQITGHVRVLSLNSAVLGGAGHLFNSSASFQPDKKFPRRILTLVRNLLLTDSNERKSSYYYRQGKGVNLPHLQELHIKLDFVPISTSLDRPFSPLVLVENLRSLQFLTVPNLQVYSVTVEKSKYGETFYFTINSLLESIPVCAYQSLETLTIISPKLRPSQTESERLPDFCQMTLSELTVKIEDGYKHSMTSELAYLLSTQSSSVKLLDIYGFYDA